MGIRGIDVQKLFSLMPESLENMVTTDEQYSSDDGTFVMFTPLATLHATAKDKPEELLDINVITNTVFTTLKDCSKDADKLKNTAKIINELNTEFEEGISCLDVLLNSLPSDNPDSKKVIDELFSCLQGLASNNIPNVGNLMVTVRAHMLFLNMQLWEKDAYEMLEYDEEESDEDNAQEKSVFYTKRETLFRNCDELFAISPHELKKMLAHEDFPALFLLSYLKNDYKRELNLMKLDHEALIKRLVTSTVELLGSTYNKEAEEALNKIGLKFEEYTFDIDKTKEILTPLIIKLIKVYSCAPKDNDGAHIHRVMINLITLVGDINVTDKNRNTPLHAAMPQEPYYGSYYSVKLNLIKYLLQKQANSSAINNQGQTPFELAAKYMKDSTAAEVISIMLQNQPVNINILESALFETISREDRRKPFSELKAFIALEEELRKFPQWSPQTFIERYNWFSNDNSKPLNIYEAKQNISDMTTLFDAVSHFKLPFNTFFAANIKNDDPATPAIVGALLASSKVCSVAKNDTNCNVLEYLKQQPEICSYLNNNIGNVMTMLENINTEKINDKHERFAISYDILKICKFDNDASPEYLLFTLKILVEHVFSTQFVPVSLVAWLPSNYAPVIEEQVKQQLKSTVFAMIDQDINIDPIKAYLTEKSSGILFRSFVNNFLNDIHEREIARLKSNAKPEILTAYESLNPSFPSEGIIGVDFEDDAKVSKFSSRPTIVNQ